MNAENSQLRKKTAYDLVGQYNQDRINGFDEEFLTSFIELIHPEKADRILDAMSGNGNLTRRLIEYCSNLSFSSLHLITTAYLFIATLS